MAKKGWDVYTLIGEVQKTSATVTRVAYVESHEEDREFKGVDIRDFFKRKGETEYSPSSKGTVMPLEKFDELKGILDKVKEGKKPRGKKATGKK